MLQTSSEHKIALLLGNISIALSILYLFVCFFFTFFLLSFVIGYNQLGHLSCHLNYSTMLIQQLSMPVHSHPYENNASVQGHLKWSSSVQLSSSIVDGDNLSLEEGRAEQLLNYSMHHASENPDHLYSWFQGIYRWKANNTSIIISSAPIQRQNTPSSVSRQTPIYQLAQMPGILSFQIIVRL